MMVDQTAAQLVSLAITSGTTVAVAYLKIRSRNGTDKEEEK